ncbi:hypothetical protein MIND_00405500 [Mycena indigotica]|uniref:HSF-type DNA-binding domain-containing protein n=1 Tax=Mycena indigotica TaxID=2126181 RepID=A0A8H6WFA0_9AGAR|nr:uncharacterized protein MIND_00405500 [Mycena indigotica]KAF7310314.1 hypothetical protein MIND_00405500 [Mycena indigotica]
MSFMANVYQMLTVDDTHVRGLIAWGHTADDSARPAIVIPDPERFAVEVLRAGQHLARPILPASFARTLSAYGFSRRTRGVAEDWVHPTLRKTSTRADWLAVRPHPRTGNRKSGRRRVVAVQGSPSEPDLSSDSEWAASARFCSSRSSSSSEASEQMSTYSPGRQVQPTSQSSLTSSEPFDIPQPSPIDVLPSPPVRTDADADSTPPWLCSIPEFGFLPKLYQMARERDNAQTLVWTARGILVRDPAALSALLAATFGAVRGFFAKLRAHGFQMTPVSYVNTTGERRYVMLWNNPGLKREPSMPVENLWWTDAAWAAARATSGPARVDP